MSLAIKPIPGRVYTVGERFDMVVDPFWEQCYSVRQLQEVEVASVTDRLVCVAPVGEPRDDPRRPGVFPGEGPCVGCGEETVSLLRVLEDGRILCPTCKVKVACGIALPGIRHTL